MSRKYRASRPRPQVVPTPQPQAKANPAFASIAFTDMPQAIPMPRNYKAYAKEGYAGNDTLYKVVKYIIQNGGAIPPKLYTDRTMEKEIESHPLLDKLDQPNLEQTGVEYREAILGYYLIAGNSYQYAIRKGRSGPPDELWTLEPDKVKPLAEKIRGIAGYQYDDFDEPILPENIGRLRTWNPNSPVLGMSALEVCAILVDQQTAARKWNLALLQNSGRMPGVWTVPAALGKNERDQLETKLNEKHAGPRNAGKSPLLDGGATFTPTSMPPSEMDWLEGIKYNAAAIANVYDISPQLIGDTSSTTYANMDQAKVASYTEAIFPALDKLYALWNNWLLPMYPDLQTAYLYYDKTTVEVIQQLIQEQKNAQADRAVKAYMAGACTLNQSLTAQGLPDLGPPGEVYRLGAVLVPADKLMEYAEQSLTTPAAPPTPAPEPIALLPDGTPAPPVTPPEETEEPPPPDDAPPPPPKKSYRAGAEPPAQDEGDDEMDDASLSQPRRHRKERRRAFRQFREETLG